MKLLPIVILLLLENISADAASQAEYFANASRGWSRSADPVVLTDLSKVEPANALITGPRQKGKWKKIPFTTAEMKGTALSIYSTTNPPLVRLPLAQRGWHAVYIGLATTSGGFNIGSNGLKAKLNDEAVFKRMANNLSLEKNRRAVIQECFLAVADLQGQSLEIAPLPGLPARFVMSKWCR